jgi:hypothetical protein
MLTDSDPVNPGSSIEVRFDPAAAGPADIANVATTNTTQTTTRMRFTVDLSFHLHNCVFAYASNLSLVGDDGNRKIVLGAYGRLS